MADQTTDLLNASREKYLTKNPMDTVVKSDPVMEKLWANKMEVDGGDSIEFPIEIGRPGALKHYAGENIPNPDRNPILLMGTLPWRKAIYEARIPGDITIENKGEARVIDYMGFAADSALKGVVEGMAYALFNYDGTSPNSHGLVGSILADANYAGINSHGLPGPIAAEAPGHKAVILDLTATAPTAPSRDHFDDVISQVVANKGKTEMILCNRVAYNKLQKLDDGRTVVQSVGGESKTDIGRAGRLYYSDIEVRIHDQIPANCYIGVEFSTLKLAVSKDPQRKLTMSEWKFLKDTLRLDAYGADMLLAYNFICNARQHDWIIKGYNFA